MRWERSFLCQRGLVGNEILSYFRIIINKDGHILNLFLVHLYARFEISYFPPLSLSFYRMVVFIHTLRFCIPLAPSSFWFNLTLNTIIAVAWVLLKPPEIHFPDFNITDWTRKPNSKQFSAFPFMNHEFVCLPDFFLYRVLWRRINSFVSPFPDKNPPIRGAQIYELAPFSRSFYYLATLLFQDTVRKQNKFQSRRLLLHMKNTFSNSVCCFDHLMALYHAFFMPLAEVYGFVIRLG